MKARGIAVAVCVCAGAAGAVMWFRGGGVSAPPMPTVEVVREAFVRHIAADGNLRPVKATPLVAPTSGGFGPLKIAWLAPDGSHVSKGDIVVKFDPTELQKNLDDGQADRAAANAKLEKERIDSAGAVRVRDTASELAQKEHDAAKTFQSKDERVYSRHQIIESELDEELSRARMDHAAATRKIEQRLGKSKLDLIEVERRRADLTIKQAEEGLTGLEIVAPHDGILVFKRDWRGDMPRVGQQVWGGQSVAEIPMLDEMEAEVFVLEIDGAGLKDGAAGVVVVEAQPDVEYKATIKRVDKLAKPRERNVPVQYFAVVLELEKTVAEVMKPGQRVRSTLILDQMEALVVPRNAIFERNSENVVFKRVGHGFEPVKVELGPATAGRVVVESGVEAGDVLALRDPTKSAKEQDDDGNEETARGGASR